MSGFMCYPCYILDPKNSQLKNTCDQILSAGLGKKHIEKYCDKHWEMLGHNEGLTATCKGICGKNKNKITCACGS